MPKRKLKVATYSAHLASFFALKILYLVSCSSTSAQDESADTNLGQDDSQNESVQPPQSAGDESANASEGDTETPAETGSESSTKTNSESSAETNDPSSDDSTGSATGEADPCEHIDCPGDQICHVRGGSPTCVCEEGRYPLGDTCVACRSIDDAVLDIDVPLHRLTLDLTLNGQKREDLVDAKLQLRDVYTGHTSVFVDSPVGKLPINVPILPGRYDLLYSLITNEPDDARPENSNAALVKDFEVSKDLDLTVDLRPVVIELDNTLNGEPVSNFGLALHGLHDEGWVIPFSSGPRITLLPGTYDFCYQLTDCVHYIPAIDLSQDRQLELELEEHTVSLGLTIDGTPLEAHEHAGFRIVGPAAHQRHSASVVGDEPAQFSIPRPTPKYDIYYSKQINWTHRPMNSDGLVARDVSLLESITIDVRSIDLVININIDGGPPATSNQWAIELFDHDPYPSPFVDASVKTPLVAGTGQAVVLPGIYDVVLVEDDRHRVLLAKGVQISNDIELAFDLTTHEVKFELDPDNSVEHSFSIDIDHHMSRPPWPRTRPRHLLVTPDEATHIRLFAGQYTFRTSVHNGWQAGSTKGSRIFAAHVELDRDREFEVPTQGTPIKTSVTVNGTSPAKDSSAWSIKARNPRVSPEPTDLWRLGEDDTANFEFVPGTYGIYYAGPNDLATQEDGLPTLDDHFLECVRIYD